MAPSEAGNQFHRQAAKYAVSEAHSSGESLRIILTAWASLDRYTLGLDIATGPGFTAFAVAEFCDTVVASDIAQGMLDQAAKNRSGTRHRKRPVRENRCGRHSVSGRIHRSGHMPDRARTTFRISGRFCQRRTAC